LMVCSTPWMGFWVCCPPGRISGASCSRSTTLAGTAVKKKLEVGSAESHALGCSSPRNYSGSLGSHQVRSIRWFCSLAV
jgi:hypothetical protein